MSSTRPQADVSRPYATKSGDTVRRSAGGVLSERINNLTEHFKTHVMTTTPDVMAQAVCLRRQLLDYLARHR